MTKKELDKYLGKLVDVSLKSGFREVGILGFTTNFCEEQGWKKPNYYTINNRSFKVSHIKKFREVK